MNAGFEKKLNAVIEAEGKQLDQATRQQLARVRRAALDEAEHARSRRPRWLLPVGAAAAAAVAAVLVWPRSPTLPEMATEDIDRIDMEIMLAEENLELYEDLEFFEWLESTDESG